MKIATMNPANDRSAQWLGEVAPLATASAFALTGAVRP
jgi:hypothetical protein